VRLFERGLHGFRRGGLIDRLRVTRGLAPMMRPALTVGDFRDRARLARLTRIEGDRIFGPGEIAEVLGEGWHVVEDWGCWSARRTATLRFAVAAPANTTMELQLSCVLPRGILQRVDARIDKTRLRRWYRLGSHDIAQPEIALRGPVPAGGVVTVQLSAFWLRRPGKSGSGGDPRWIGVGLRSVAVRLSPLAPAARGDLHDARAG
jgi:hypothetical protein